MYALLLVCVALSLAADADPGDRAAANPSTTFHEPPGPLSPEAVTEDWPAFLGGQHNGVIRETHLQTRWPAGRPRLVWEMNKGTGYSAPSVVGRRLVFFHRVDDREVIECLEAETGERTWQVGYASRYRDRYGYNNGPRASPVIEDGRVYTLGAEGMLRCTDLGSGQSHWVRNLKTQFEQPQGFFGVTATPLVEGNLLIVNVGAPGHTTGACVVAYDKVTGEQVWQTGDQWGASYASPVPALIHGRRRVLVVAGGESRPPVGGLLCIDPADGRIDFRFPWRSRSYESVNAACPVAIGNRVFVSASYGTGGALVDIAPNFRHRVVWTTQELATHFNTSIHHEGFLYGFDGRHQENAALVCLDLDRGAETWRFVPEWIETYEAYGRTQRKPYTAGRGMLLRADGRFLCLGESGHLLWLELSPAKHEVVARTWLFAAGQSWTPPVISRGLLYVTQNARDFITGDPPRLLCYDLRR